jgi:hypothetical protein
VFSFSSSLSKHKRAVHPAVLLKHGGHNKKKDLPSTAADVAKIPKKKPGRPRKQKTCCAAETCLCITTKIGKAPKSKLYFRITRRGERILPNMFTTYVKQKV